MTTTALDCCEYHRSGGAPGLSCGPDRAVTSARKCRACDRCFVYRRDALDDLTDETCARGEELGLCPWCLDEREGLAYDSPAFAAPLWRPEDDVGTGGRHDRAHGRVVD